VARPKRFELSDPEL